MIKLRTEVVRRLQKSPELRMKLAMSMNLSEYGIRYNLKTNHDNNSLTKIDALLCIKQLLNFDSIEQIILSTKPKT
jgi:hypothetical protein